MREIVEIQQDLNGKWFCFFPETKEYTPGFEERNSLIKYLEIKYERR